MKTSTILSNLKKKNNEYMTFLENSIKKLSINSNNDKLKAKEELLLQICEDHDLEYKKLYKKYIKPLKKKNKDEMNDLIDIDSDSENDNEDSLSETKSVSLERITIKDKICYVENIEGGFIYDSEVKKIGVLQKGEYVLYDS